MKRKELTEEEKVIDAENIKVFVKARKRIIDAVEGIKNDMIARMDPKELESKYEEFAVKLPKAWAFVLTSGKENVEKFIQYNQEYLKVYLETSGRHELKKYEADKAVSQKIANLCLYSGNHRRPSNQEMKEANNKIKNKLQL